MPIRTSVLVNEIEPERTVLLFGAGSLLPSNAPSVAKLQAHFEKTFGVSAKVYNLAEQTGIIDQRTKDRQRFTANAATHLKTLLPKLGKSAYEIVVNIVSDIGAATAKKILGL